MGEEKTEQWKLGDFFYSKKSLGLTVPAQDGAAPPSPKKIRGIIQTEDGIQICPGKFNSAGLTENEIVRPHEARIYMIDVLMDRLREVLEMDIAEG